MKRTYEFLNKIIKQDLKDIKPDYTIINDEGLETFKESAHTFLVDIGLVKGDNE